MDYEKELSRIRKLLEKENCSNDNKSDEDSFSADSSGKEDCLEEDVHVPDTDNFMSDYENLQKSPEKKLKFAAWFGKHKTTWWRKNTPKFHWHTKSSNIIKFRQRLIGLSLNAIFQQTSEKSL